jgi:DNA polymerase III sliding clamp (beta) subunit (PCNA family)
MKLKIKVGVLLQAVESVLSTIDKKGEETGTNSILAFARRGEAGGMVFFYSTMTKAETVVKCVADVEEPGECLLNPVQLRSGLLHRDPEAEAEIGEVTEDKVTKLTVKVGRAKFCLPQNPNGLEGIKKLMLEIPFKQAEAYTIKGTDLAEFIRRVSFCSASENEGTQQFELSGMKILVADNGYQAQATDGHMCGRIIIKGEKGPVNMKEVLLPNEALNALSKLVRKEEDVKVIEGKKNGQGVAVKLFFKLGENVFFGAKLLTGSYPNIQSVLNAHKPDFWFKVNRESLKQLLDRAPAFSDAETPVIRLEVLGTQLTLVTTNKKSAITDDVAIEPEEGMPADLKIGIVVNLPYLKNVASGSKQENLRIGISDTNVKAKFARALVVDDADEKIDALYAIMPVRQ